MLTKGKFATAISCIDGRVHLPIINWLMREHSVDYVDIITDAGVDGSLSDYHSGSNYTVWLKSRVAISIEKHGSDTVVISAHHDCAGNPVTKEEHIKMLGRCVANIQGWGFGIKHIVSIWVDDKWKVNIIDKVDL